MGRLTLMIVAAAVLGGATLKLGMNLIAGDTASGRSEAQADVLARQIAETGQSLVLASMVGEEGFVDPGVTGCPDPGTAGCTYDGGTFTVASVRSADNREVTVTVKGRFGGAAHTVVSTYSFDPMEYPGPIWLDVPYATAAVANGARVSGTASDHPSRYDSRKFDDIGLASIGLNRGTMASAIAGQLSIAQGALNVPTPASWEARPGQSGPLLEDLSKRNDVVDAEGLYQSAVAAMAAGDVTFATAKTVTGTQTWGARDGVTRVRGALTVNGTLRGSGILIVEGPFVVPANRTFTWDGIVIVRDDRQLLPVQLLGNADITGGLIVAQNALPPGGHMDVTVMNGPTGMSAAPGTRPSPNWPLASPVDYPWWEHTHRFDLEPVRAPRGGHIEFARNGRGSQEAETQFWATLQALGSERVRVEFKHPESHGFARYEIGLASERDPIKGSVRSGFGAFASPTNAFASRSFAANDLRTLTLDVQSLRALRRLFDGEGSCTGGSWPFCVGRDWNRSSALSLRLIRESGNKTVYDAAVYWHMAKEERDAHLAEEAAWMASIRGGTSFGTRFEMGPQASVTYSLATITRLAEKVGFDGNEVTLLASSSEHTSAAEMRAQSAASAAMPPAMPPPAGYNPPSGWSPSFYVCHTKSDGEIKSEKINSRNNYETHVTGHRDPVRSGGSCRDD